MEKKECGCFVKDINNAFGEWIGVEQFWCSEHSKDACEKFGIDYHDCRWQPKHTLKECPEEMHKLILNA